MKKLLLIFLLAAASAKSASVDIVRATITLTNAPTTNGMNLAVTYVAGSTTRIWTNDASATPSLFIGTNLTLAGSATNLYNHLAAYPIYPSYGLGPKSGLSSNSVTIISSPGGSLVIATQNWALITYATNSFAVPLTMLVRVPLTVEASTNQTYIASKLAQGINDLSTNAFTTNAVALSNYVSVGHVAQTLGNKTLTNGVGNGQRLTNVIAFEGTIFRATNGYFTNAVLDTVKLTNSANYGNAFRSPGGGSASEQFGSGAIAVTNGGFAAGSSALAQKASDTAVGSSATASGSYSLAGGYSAISSGFQSVGVGAFASASGSNSVALGVLADNQTYADTVAIGTSVLNTDTNQIKLGNSTYKVEIDGRLIAASITNITATGTNRILGDLSFPMFNNSALANGNNAAILIGTNFFMNAYGPTAAYALNGFQGGRDGKEFVFIKTNSLVCTISNDSGSDPTAANRIWTGTGADVTVTNNPGCVRFIYNATLAKWLIVSKSN